MWMTLFVPLALGQELSLPPSTDLDGDGEVETFIDVDGELRLDGVHLLCADSTFYCEVRVVDVRAGDAFKELRVCVPGPRDGVYCALYAVRAGALVPLDLRVPDAPHRQAVRVTTYGNNIVLVDVEGRPFGERQKFTLAEDGLSLNHVPQPFYYVGKTVHIDDSFPITMAPGAGAVVANVRPDSEVLVVMESAAPGGFVLVRVSSGLVGWTSWSALIDASRSLRTGLGAG